METQTIIQEIIRDLEEIQDDIAYDLDYDCTAYKKVRILTQKLEKIVNNE